MARPTETTPSAVFPTWATSATGLSRITYPGSTKQSDGWAVSEKPPAHWFNWFKNSVGQWLLLAIQARTAHLWDFARLEAQLRASVLFASIRSFVPSSAGGLSGMTPARAMFITGVEGGTGATARGANQGIVVVYHSPGGAALNARVHGGLGGTLGNPSGLSGTAINYEVIDVAMCREDQGTRGAVLAIDAAGNKMDLISYEIDYSSGTITQTVETGFGTAYSQASDGDDVILLSATGLGGDSGTPKPWFALTATRRIYCEGATGNGAAHSIPSIPRAGFSRVRPSGYTTCCVTANGAIYRAINLGTWSLVRVDSGLSIGVPAGLSMICSDTVGIWAALIPNGGGTVYDLTFSIDDGVTWSSFTVAYSAMVAGYEAAEINCVGPGTFAITGKYGNVLIVRISDANTAINVRTYSYGFFSIAANIVPRTIRILDGKLVALTTGGGTVLIGAAPPLDVY